MASEETFGVAIVGCGTVGGATAQLLTADRDVTADRLRRPLELKYVVDVDFTRARQLGLDATLLTDELDKALADASVHVVAELVGGTTIAREITRKALSAGKHVVTANKALLAHHGPELFALARENNVCLAFEASCGGGIPIVRALVDGLSANRVDALYGIVNGTCNFILTSMIEEGLPYADALAQAQEMGLAEADPTLDVSGGDSAHKIAILAALAFGRSIDLEQIPVEGIDQLELCDVELGQELGYVTKLLAIARRQERGVSLQVAPALIPLDHPLAWVAGPFNAVSVYGHATGHTMYYGRGAGGMPTASAVVADMVSVSLGSASGQFEAMTLWPDLCEPADQLPPEAVVSRYYIRTVCRDRAGVLGNIAAILAERDISISSVLQHESADDLTGGEGVPVIITTHPARKGDVRHALAKVNELDDVLTPSVCIDIVDEHPERF